MPDLNTVINVKQQRQTGLKFARAIRDCEETRQDTIPLYRELFSHLNNQKDNPEYLRDKQLQYAESAHRWLYQIPATPNTPSDDQFELENEIAKLFHEILPSTPHQNVLKRCKERSLDSSVPSFMAMPYSATNDLYWELIKTLFQPTTLGSMLDKLFPDVSLLVYEDGLFKTLPLTSIITPITHITQLTSYVLNGSLLFDSSQLDSLSAKQHQTFFKAIHHSYPLLAKALYQHNGLCAQWSSYFSHTSDALINEDMYNLISGIRRRIDACEKALHHAITEHAVAQYKSSFAQLANRFSAQSSLLQINDQLSISTVAPTQDIENYQRLHTVASMSLLKNELFAIDHILRKYTSIAQLQSAFKEHCIARNKSHRGSAFDYMFAADDDLSNHLHWDITKILFNPRNVGEIIVIVMPHIKTLVSAELQRNTSNPSNLFKRSREELVLSKFPIETFSRYTSLALQELKGCVTYQDMLFDVEDISSFDLELHLKWYQILQRQYPGLFDALYQHNQLLKTIASDFSILENKSETPRNRLSEIIKLLTWNSSFMTGEVFAGKAAEQGAYSFKLYLDSLPYEFKQQLLSIKDRDNRQSIDDILLHLARGNCTEMAAQALIAIINNPNNEHILNQRPYLSEAEELALCSKFSALRQGNQFNITRDFREAPLSLEQLASVHQPIRMMKTNDVMYLFKIMPINAYEWIFRKIDGIHSFLYSPAFIRAMQDNLLEFTKPQQDAFNQALIAHREVGGYSDDDALRRIVQYAIEINNSELLDLALSALVPLRVLDVAIFELAYFPMAPNQRINRGACFKRLLNEIDNATLLELVTLPLSNFPIATFGAHDPLPQNTPSFIEEIDGYSFWGNVSQNSQIPDWRKTPLAHGLLQSNIDEFKRYPKNGHGIDRYILLLGAHRLSEPEPMFPRHYTMLSLALQNNNYVSYILEKLKGDELITALKMPVYFPNSEVRTGGLTRTTRLRSVERDTLLRQSSIGKSPTLFSVALENEQVVIQLINQLSSIQFHDLVEQDYLSLLCSLLSFPRIVNTLLEYFEATKKGPNHGMDVLKERKHHLLRSAITNLQGDSLRVILSKYRTETLKDLLSDKDNASLLQEIVNHRLLFSIFLTKFELTELLDLVHTAQSPTLYASRRVMIAPHCFDLIVNSWPPQVRLSRIQSYRNHEFMHLTAQSGDTTTMDTLLSLLSSDEERIAAILYVSAKNGQTPLFDALVHADLFYTMLMKIPENLRLQTLNRPYGPTHTSILDEAFKKPQYLETILYGLTQRRRLSGAYSELTTFLNHMSSLSSEMLDRLQERLTFWAGNRDPHLKTFPLLDAKLGTIQNTHRLTPKELQIIIMVAEKEVFNQSDLSERVFAFGI